MKPPMKPAMKPDPETDHETGYETAPWPQNDQKWRLKRDRRRTAQDPSTRPLATNCTKTMKPPMKPP